MPDDRKVLHEFKRNAEETMRVSLSTFKGRTYVDIRLFYTGRQQRAGADQEGRDDHPRAVGRVPRRRRPPPRSSCRRRTSGTRRTAGRVVPRLPAGRPAGRTRPLG